MAMPLGLQRVLAILRHNSKSFLIEQEGYGPRENWPTKRRPRLLQLRVPMVVRNRRYWHSATSSTIGAAYWCRQATPIPYCSRQVEIPTEPRLPLAQRTLLVKQPWPQRAIRGTA